MSASDLHRFIFENTQYTPAHTTNNTHNYSRAPAMPEVVHTDDSVSSLVDVDSPHISSVPSDYESQSVKTDTQAERIEHEKFDAALEKEQKAEQKAKEKARQAKDKAATKINKGKNEVQGNPVFFGNAVVVAILGTVLGVGAYKKYNQGELNWKTAGIWGGVVGLFATADYFVTGYACPIL
jgi:hypothetical protein